MSKTLKHEIKADHLLEKGLEIIWSKGYNGTSVNDIVKAAEVPKGSFYFYFDSKEDFVIKALDKYFTMQFVPAVDVLKNSDGSPKQRLLNFYKFRVNILKEQLDCKMGCLGCNLSNEMSEHNENIRNAVLDRHNRIKQEIIAVVKVAQELGEIKTSVNAEDLVGFIEDAGKGAMITMKEMKDAYPIDNYINMITNLLMR